MPPKSVDAPDKTITLSYKDYLDGQNEVVQAINNHSSILQSFFGSFSMSMATMRATLIKTRESLKTVTSENDSDLLEQYPALSELLAREPHQITSALSLPSAGGLPTTLAGAMDKKTRKKREQKAKDPNAPKRPNTAFFLFLESTRPILRKEMGDIAKPGDIAAEQRVRWKSLPEEEKEIYRAQYQANFKEYQGEVADYKAKGGHVEEDDLQALEDDVEVANADTVEDSSDDTSNESTDDDEPPPPPPPAAKKGKKPTAAATAAAAAAAAKDDISSKIDPRLTATELPKPAATPAKSPEKEKKPRGKAAQAAAAAAAEVAAAAATAAEETTTKAKPGRKKKVVGSDVPTSTPAAPPASTPTAPAAAAAVPEVDGAASARKKRKSGGVELEERKKKRKETLGDDY